MADRPRRSTRNANSPYNSPGQTPAPNTPGAHTPVSRLAHHVAPGSTPASPSPQYLPYPPRNAPPHGSTGGGAGGSGGGGSLIQAGSALLSQSHPGFQPTHVPIPAGPHALPQSWPVSKSSAPVPPFTPLQPPQPPQPSSALPAPVPQALYTTFPSRMRAGTTTLMQPIQQPDLLDPLARTIDGLSTPMNESRYDYSTPTSSHNPYRSSARASTRRRAAAGFIRYAEADDSAEEFEDETEDENGPRGTKRKAVGSPGRGSVGVHTPDVGGDDAGSDDGFKTLLGLPPPGNKTIAKRLFRPTAHLYHPEEEMIRQAARNEVLVPIRIELETETHRIKDTFTWNMNEKLVTPFQFAKLLLEDLDLPIEPYAGQIQTMIQQQVQEAVGVADIEMEPASGGIWSAARLEDKDGALALPQEERKYYDPEEEAVKEARQWDWGIDPKDEAQRAWRRKMQDRLASGKGLGAEEDDLRVIVDYEVQILRHSLRDRLEWDLCSPLTPELFAAQLCKDLGLSGEAQMLISNSVREQLLNHKRAALELGLLGVGRVLREKEEEIEQAGREIEQERREKERRRLEGIPDTAPSTREASATPQAQSQTQTQVNSDEEDVETLHLTATATREPSVSAAATPVPTRSSSRLHGVREPTPQPPPKLSPIQRLHAATYTIREILSRGPRPLEAVWRDITESREFGPLLERLSDEDLEKIEEANVRASRRNRREAQRGIAGSSRRRR